MPINNYYQTQMNHETSASLVTDEIRNWNATYSAAKPISVAYAVGVRVLTAAYFGKWLVVEAVTFLPKMVVMAETLLSSEETGFAFCQKVLSVYWKVMRAFIVEASIFAAACIAPELAYGVFESHKPLFRIQLNALIATMPDFPYVDKHMADEFPEFAEFGWLWADWKLDNSLWKNGLLEACLNACKKRELTLSELANRDSLIFKKLTFSEVTSKLGFALDQLQEKGELTLEKLHNMTPLACIILFNRLKSETQKRLLTLSPALELAFENETIQQISLFEVYDGHCFRAPHTTQICHILLEEIKKARDGFLKQGLYTVDDIEGCMDPAYSAMISLGIYRLIENAELLEPGILRMTSEKGLGISLRNETQFFGAKKYFLDLKEKLIALTTTQKELLFRRLCMKEENVPADEQVSHCFHLIGRCRSDIIEPRAMKVDRLKEEDKTPWNEAFEIEVNGV